MHGVRLAEAAWPHIQHPKVSFPEDDQTMQQTLVLIKPDGVQRRLVGEIIQRFERKGLRLVAAKLVQADRLLAEKHYAVHLGKPFYQSLVEFITSGPTLALVLEGREAVAVVRAMLGPTDGAKAAPGTIRGDFGCSIQNNLVHGSDSPDNAAAEIALWFRPEELISWQPVDQGWIAGG
jgi:nucleoside-diphosphate kinase